MTTTTITTKRMPRSRPLLHGAGSLRDVDHGFAGFGIDVMDGRAVCLELPARQRSASGISLVLLAAVGDAERFMYNLS